ncbi:NACHT domain-containing protein [Actinoplanes sp. GCM10030250]|uniref:NACHT domain-containing protein n=1 Tax=Actinoplanes sp. GCM10030250 TaxID=3273376 RepID=UPI00362392F7
MEPPITYRGALQLLGKHDPMWLSTLDGLLGGAILSSGAIKPIAGMFGLVDQKNEAMTLLRKGYGAAKDRLLKTGGYERQYLVTAAHTVIVLTSLFDALRDSIGKEKYGALEFTDNEKLRRLSPTTNKNEDARRIDMLYRTEVPAPSVDYGFEENLPRLRKYYRELIRSTLEFAEKLAAGNSVPAAANLEYIDDLADLSIGKYIGSYLQLAVDVPEFRFFAELKEFGSTRKTIRGVGAKLDSLHERITEHHAHTVEAHSRALTAFEVRLREISPDVVPAATGALEVLRRTNAGALQDPILPHEQLHDIPDITSPAIKDIYVEPHFRVSVYSRSSRPTEESWWRRLHRRQDLNLFLASYFASPSSTGRPLLILGHPGAGKSLLTRILTARLPAEAFVAVRVPLREVSADALLHEQIDEALNQATYSRVNWREMNDATEDRMRVFIFDGLDELLQAGQLTHSDFLQDIADFQRREAQHGQPAAVLVTSRTVVADRVAIPLGTSVLHLEPFDDDQVAEWLRNWRQANARLDGGNRLLRPSSALRQRELARQPLLLMMLAVYQSDPTTEGLRPGMSSGELYQAVVRNFLRREARKHADSPSDLEARRADQSWRMSVTAFAMFNRGRQSIMDDEIGSDLLALDGLPAGTPEQRLRLGQQAVGSFFFIHTAQAGSPGGDHVRRSYEFLHATFGEFLVAERTSELLFRLADSHRTANGSTGHDIDDHLLFALLSHRPLAIRSSIANFVNDLVPAGDPRREPVGAAITAILHGLRTRRGDGTHDAYAPTPDDHLSRLATYSANLVVLRVHLTDNGVPITDLAPSDEAWQSLVRLWWSGLDGDGWAAQVQALDTDGRTRVVFPRGPRSFDVTRPVIGYAQLTGDVSLEDAITTGYTELRLRNRRPDMGSDR